MLTVSHLSKRYPGSSAPALDDVGFTIGDGEIVGLIGRNGAGKTTLMAMMAKARRPTTGTITYRGVDILSRDDALDRFGIMIQPVFLPHISAEDNLRFYLGVHGDKAHERNIRPVLELVGLWRYRTRRPSGFSFGMKQRLALAIAMVNDPEFLILDEPFVGLDPDGVLQLITVLRRWAVDRGVSMLVSSHQLNELQELCGRFLFLENGRLADEFAGERGSTIVVDLSRPLGAGERSTIAMLDPSAVIRDDGASVEIAAEGASLNRVVGTLASTAGIAAIHDKATRLAECFGEA
ncbi:ABC transporter ATP-binding protein [Bifidobacterium sp. MA2]|uniref:ABC transporter ATP-binding protein n=1 Tax=Bifidobacterium santillanense TaxID=2809028 RepID=A0ABS5UMT5_9BIFI|nr:ABC transporter ATP-binding protein [Bifidobacterium santillanense]MBT1172183.1 ABC transporter ATP-binding protein [Bifidobacterium santillanense]